MNRAIGNLSLMTGRVRELICARSMVAEVQNRGNCFSFGQAGLASKKLCTMGVHGDGELNIFWASVQMQERGLKREKINNHNDRLSLPVWRLKCVDSKNYKEKRTPRSPF